MKVRIKKLSEKAVIPKHSKNGDAGLDLTATSKEFDEHGNVVYGTSLAIEIPYGYVGLLFPRSSNAKYDLLNTNSVGVIDSGYRGEIMMKYKIIYHTYKNHKLLCKILEQYVGIEVEEEISKSDLLPQEYNIGDRIGQLIIMPYPQIEFEESDKLTQTERGTGSYGSTGN